MSVTVDADSIRAVTSTDYRQYHSATAIGTCAEVITAGQIVVINEVNRLEVATQENVGAEDTVAIALNSGDEDLQIAFQTAGLCYLGDGVLEAGASYYLVGEGAIGLFSELSAYDRIVTVGMAVTEDYLLLDVRATDALVSGSSSSSSSSSLRG